MKNCNLDALPVCSGEARASYVFNAKLTLKSVIVFLKYKCRPSLD